ncbi:hypothetical protein B296_00038394 [Ensete ventricosum]|uniref:Uncharacterized protein n=1 Tax=Ensete ventricosum TaxID=4639 RepID=A0A426ZEU7_ENSVE|nr:hypothetical protein B296_00038394 [Ensete ventricosum]
MKIKGFLEQQPVIILIDIGSMINFINSKVATRLMFQKEDCSRISSDESHNLPPVISRHVPSELPDPFGESPSKLPPYHPILGPMPKLDPRSMYDL